MTGDETTTGECENGTETETAAIDLEELPETVWATTGGQGVFHTRRCRYFPEKAREWDVEAALEWRLRPCGHCQRDGPAGPGRGEGHYQTLLEIGESRDDRPRSNPWPRPAPADD